MHPNDSGRRIHHRCGVKPVREVCEAVVFAGVVPTDIHLLANITETVNSAGGTVTDILIPTAHLPLLQPLRDLGLNVFGHVDGLEAALRPIVDAGYSRNDPKPTPMVVEAPPCRPLMQFRPRPSSRTLQSSLRNWRLRPSTRKPPGTAPVAATAENTAAVAKAAEPADKPEKPRHNVQASDVTHQMDDDKPAMPKDADAGHEPESNQPAENSADIATENSGGDSDTEGAINNRQSVSTCRAATFRCPSG